MQKNTIMTDGNIAKKMIFFALPLIVGNIFQQLYSSVDAAIVGIYIGADALAAVGAGTALLDMLLGFSVGIAAGTGVLIAQFYGMQDKERVQAVVHTSLLLAAVIGAFLTIFGIAYIPQIYRWMQIPDYIFHDAVLYMRIYFCSMVFVVLYNMAAGILNAAGNSKWVLLFLAISSCTNIMLDFFFVQLLKIGIVGVAIATDISQALACILVFIYLCRVNDLYRLSVRKFRCNHAQMLDQILAVSLPTGIQNTVKAFSNVLIQANVNLFGTVAMAGYTAFLKIDGFNWLPVMSFSMAAATFTGQNVGAGKKERVKKGIVICVIMGFVYTAATGVLSMLFPKQLLGLFSSDSSVVEYGFICLKCFMPFYWMLGTFQILLGSVRGMGRTFASLILNSFAMCVFRILYIVLIKKFFLSFEAVIAVYPLSWMIGMLITILYIFYNRDFYANKVGG